MDDRLKKIYNDTIPHSSFLDERSIISCMYQSYQLGCDDMVEWMEKNGYLKEKKEKIQGEWFQFKNHTNNNI